MDTIKTIIFVGYFALIVLLGTSLIYALSYLLDSMAVLEPDQIHAVDSLDYQTEVITLNQDNNAYKCCASWDYDLNKNVIIYSSQGTRPARSSCYKDYKGFFTKHEWAYEFKTPEGKHYYCEKTTPTLDLP